MPEECLGVGAVAHGLGKSTAVIAAGERWEDGSLRPCLEDMLGAGAIIKALGGSGSPEAKTAADAYSASQSRLGNTLRRCASGIELIERGFEADVDLASQLNCSTAVPWLHEGAFVNRVTA